MKGKIKSVGHTSNPDTLGQSTGSSQELRSVILWPQSTVGESAGAHLSLMLRPKTGTTALNVCFLRVQSQC